MLCECVLCMPGQRWGGSECFTSQALARLAEGAGDHVWACLRLLLPSHTQTLELAQARSHAGLPLHPPVLRWRYTKADTSVWDVELGRAKKSKSTGLVEISNAYLIFNLMSLTLLTLKETLWLSESGWMERSVFFAKQLETERLDPVWWRMHLLGCDQKEGLLEIITRWFV